jgi:hypothetical protein
VRRNCDLIRGTEYRSDAEREWFEEHCLEPTPEPTEAAATATPGSGGGEVDQGTCNAVSSGNHWVVTCSVRLVGCHTAACAESLSACVYADPVRVVPTTQC